MYRISLVKESLVIYFFQKIPQSLNVAVVVGDVRIIHIHPVTNPLRHVFPFGSVLHDLLAASLVVLLDGDGGSDVIFVNSEFLLDADFDGKAMGVPTGPSGDLVTCLGLVTADSILDGSGHHMVDSRLSIG